MEQSHDIIIKRNEKKLRQQYDNNTFWTLFIMLLPFLIYSISLHATPSTHNIAHGGQAWKCSNCRTYQWQDSSNKDWSGTYKCKSCGAKK